MKTTEVIISVLMIFTAIISCSRKIVPSEVSRGKGKEYDSAAFEYVYIEAIKQKLLGNQGDAIKYMEQCLRINPESSGANYQIAQILLAGGDLNNAKKYLLTAHKLDNLNTWYIMTLAGTYYKEKNLDSAILFYEKAVRYFPDQELLKLNLGNLYSEDKRFDKANEIFEGIDKKYGVNEASTVAIIMNYTEAKEYDKALAFAFSLIEKYPDNMQYNNLLAEIYKAKGDDGKATEVYEIMMEKNPEDPEIQLSVSKFLLSQKKYEELLTLLNIVILNTDINREQKLDLFASIFEDKEMIKKYGERLILTIMILEANYERDGIVKLLRPELLTMINEWDDAAARLEEIIKEEPENYYAWEKLLLVYFDSGNFKKLQERGEECTLKFNRSFLAKILYATGASENKDYNTALEELKKANILAGNNKDLLLQVITIKADTYYKMKNFEETFKTFDEAVKTNNTDITLLNNYAYYLAEQNIQLKEAEKMAKEVIRKEGNNNTFLDTYGWVLFKRGKINEAEKIFQQIITSEEKPDAEWYEHYGYIKKKKRDCKSAIENWNIAIKLDTTKIKLIDEIEKCKR